MSINIYNYINGELSNPIENNYLDVTNPATGEIYSKVPDSSLSDLDAAISAAKKALYNWRNTSIQDRSNWLRKLSEQIRKNIDKLALAESIDTGKPISLAKSLDIPRSSYNLEFYADLITSYNNKSYFTNINNNQAINYTLKHPLGIVACISPWNLPLYLLTWKIAPALVTGNCVIAKPSEVTPYTASLLAELCNEINFPAGVLSILHGSGSKIGELITTHPDISAISFTGGTKTGAHIAQQAVKHLKKISLELGGKNPAIVFADCDIDKTVDIISKSAFTNQGQICLCNSRIYIESKIYNIFKEKLINKTNNIKIGHPQNNTTEFGAITSKLQYEKILNIIDHAVINNNGSLLTNLDYKNYKNKEHPNGYYIKPTILENLDINTEINQEETFGPVITLSKFDSEEEAIELANNTKYGLAACVFSNTISTANRVASKIQAGTVWINHWMLRELKAPFGGMKASGIGREGGYNSLDFFTEEQNICFNIQD